MAVEGGAAEAQQFPEPSRIPHPNTSPPAFPCAALVIPPAMAIEFDNTVAPEARRTNNSYPNSTLVWNENTTMFSLTKHLLTFYGNRACEDKNTA